MQTDRQTTNSQNTTCSIIKFLFQIVSKQHINICGSQQNAFNNNNLTHLLTRRQTKITT